MGKDLFKTIAVIVFSFFVVSCCHGNKQVQLNSYRTSTVEARDAAVFIEVSAEGEDRQMGSSGSGVGIAHAAERTMVMTAGHICKAAEDPAFDSSEIIVRTFEGRAYYAEVLAISQHFDLCLLLVPEILPVAKIARDVPESGDKVYYSGYPVGFYVPGVLHHFEGHMAGVDMVGDHLYNIPAIGGSSGSPVYNERGEIVGILSAVMVDFNWMTFAVGTENIIDFMRDFNYETR